jgi:hypothetical protein
MGATQSRTMSAMAQILALRDFKNCRMMSVPGSRSWRNLIEFTSPGRVLGRRDVQAHYFDISLKLVAPQLLVITFGLPVCENFKGISLAHISRKELKKDEVRETFAHGAEAVMLHQQLTMWLVVGALAIAVGFFGWKTYTERQTVRASAAFDEAMKVFQARTISPGEPAQPGELTYTDDKVKFGESAKKFGDVGAKFRAHRQERRREEAFPGSGVGQQRRIRVDGEARAGEPGRQHRPAR